MFQQDNKPDNTTLTSIGKYIKEERPPAQVEEFVNDYEVAQQRPAPTSNPNRTKSESPTKNSQN
jgi:hypothetical protein